VGEIFAKKFAKNFGVNWQRVMQVLASYNFESNTFDVRLELSGLKNLKEKILFDFLNFVSQPGKTYRDAYNPFALLGTQREIDDRIRIEMKKKSEVKSLIISEAKKFSTELAKNFHELEPMIFLRGSASPRSRKIFLYYDDEEKIFVSDIDIQILLPYITSELINYSIRKAYDFSLKNRIPINVYCSHLSQIGDGLIKYGYPLFIPYEFNKNSCET
jgi:hypothetical protein